MAESADLELSRVALGRRSAGRLHARRPGGDIGGPGRENRRTIWKSQVPGAPPAAYASAIVMDCAGQRQYVQFTQRGVVAVAAADGKFLWRYDRPANRMGISCATPVTRDACVFASSAYGTGGGLVKLSEDAQGGVKAEEVYFTKNMQNHHGGMILLDGYLYGATGGNEGGRLCCLRVRHRQGDVGQPHVPKGSVALADGLLYYRTEAGPMILVEPNPKRYIERGRFSQPDRSRATAWPHPVVANGKLYLRDQDVLLCYDVNGKQPTTTAPIGVGGTH